MIHKLSIVAVLALILYIVWSSMSLGYIAIWALFALFAVAMLYYVTTSVLTPKMVEKALGKGIFSFKAGMIDKTGKNLISGRMVATPTELMFVRRRGDMGGVRVIWSTPTPAVESYTLGKVDEYHMGISLKIKGEKKAQIFPSREIGKLEKDFRLAIGWPEEVPPTEE